MALKSRTIKDSYFERVRDFPPRKIRDADEHRQALAVVSRFAGRQEIDEGAMDYLGVLTDLIAEYEKGTGHTIDTSNLTPLTPAQLVRHLMDQNDLTVSGLARQIGAGQSNLSEMLSGKRESTDTH